MDLASFSNQLANHVATMQTLTVGISPGQATWKPDPQSWSILEVINHLYDEERLDFRLRLDLILHQPDQPWPPINPAGWVSERIYNQRDLAESLANFLDERRKSLAWLQVLDEPDWDTSVTSPFGTMRAGDMFAAWVAHDLLHLRQLVELHWAYNVQSAQPYLVNYAGEW
jgi:hypothetical protein